MTACGGPATGPEEQVRNWLRQGQEAAEAKERRALMRMISPAYADARGNSRDSLENLLRIYFLRQQKIALVTRIEEVTVIGGTAAKVSLTAAMAGTNDGTMGFSADVYHFTFELEHDGDDWLLIAAKVGGVRQRLALGGDWHGQTYDYQWHGLGSDRLSDGVMREYGAACQ